MIADTNPPLPTMSAYLDWAKSEGCAVVITHAGDDARYLIVGVTSPRGLRAVEIVIELGASLASTTVARLDRRLGLKSYLFT